MSQSYGMATNTKEIREMRAYKVFRGAILCMACMAVGCGSGTEGPHPTVAVSSTARVLTEQPTPTETVTTEQPMPTETVVTVPGGLPIDEEHFGDEAFCKILKSCDLCNPRSYNSLLYICK